MTNQPKIIARNFAVRPDHITMLEEHQAILAEQRGGEAPSLSETLRVVLDEWRRSHEAQLAKA